MVTTVDDLATHLRDFLGADATTQASRRIQKAIRDALLDMSTYCRWSYYYSHGRINTDASFALGTVTFDFSTKTLTFSASVPSWIGSGTITINSVGYPITERISPFNATLSQPFMPQSSITTGVPFEVYHDSYLLPADFTQIDAPHFEVDGFSLNYVHPTEWLRVQRYDQAGGLPEIYTVTGDPDNPGRFVFRMYPHPVEVKTIDFFYRRTPKELRTTKYSDGQVATTAASVVITGTNTVWTQAMVGSVIRLSADSVSEPTDFDGANPYEFEFFIKSVDSATQLTVYGAPSVTRSGIKYVISDHIDIDDKTMLRAFRRNCERQVAFGFNMESRAAIDAEYKESLYQAMEADQRSFQTRRIGSTNPFRRFIYGGDSP
jgi:hypothetical protein